MTGELGSTWWSLGDRLAAVTAREALLEHGVPWLDRFPDQESILKGFERVDAPWELGMTPAASLDIAQIYAAQGRKDDERRTLERYVTNPVHPRMPNTCTSTSRRSDTPT